MMDKLPHAGTLKQVVSQLSEQAYLFVLGLVILVIAAIYIPSPDTALVVVAVFGAIGLGYFAIASVEQRKKELVEEVRERSVITSSPEDRTQVEKLQNEREAIDGLLGGVVSNDEDTYFIYSSTIADKVYDHGEPAKQIDQPFYRNVKEVTTILDARGIAKIYAMLHLAGKTDRLREGIAESFDPTHWHSNLILIGSGTSNPVTVEALEMVDCPFQFSADMNAIDDQGSGTSTSASRFEHTDHVDHAILAKLKVKTPNGNRVYVVAAGIGPWGTAGACFSLAEQAVELYKNWGDAPFACIIQVATNQWTMPHILDSRPLQTK